MTSLEKATKLVNKWVSSCIWLDPEKQSIDLVILIADLIDQVEQEAYERGVQNGHGEQAIKNHNERS